MRNFFKREKKKDPIIHSHPILDDECHDLNKIKILDSDNLHIHMNVEMGHEHECFDRD